MEDRHTISEPRFLRAEYDSTGKMQWEVDVFRTGVEKPIETLLINHDNLPPRRRKNKIVWRLPSDPQILPSFGTEDKKRILELYKEQKKRRKKEKAALQKNDSNVSATNSVKEEEPIMDEAVTSSNIKTTIDSESEKVSPLQNETPVKPKSNKKKSAKKKKQEPSMDLVTDSQSSASKLEIETPEKSNDSGVSTPLPPGFDFNIVEKKESSVTPDIDWSDPMNHIQSHTEKISLTTKKNGSPKSSVDTCNDTSPQLGYLDHHPINTGRYIFVSANSPNMAVAAARSFAEVYYPSLTQGLTIDLAEYYTIDAQKSVSVGGAHSVVTGYNSVCLQLASFSKANFAVKGVVAQDSTLGGVHILVTGLIQPVDAGVSNFAHSIHLTTASSQHLQALQDPIKAFQIRNDALSILATDSH